MPNDKSVKPGPGGRRPGAGRPKGARGKANVEREARAREIVADVMTKLGHASADDLGPLEIALLIMKIHFQNNDLSGALHAAAIAMPFVSPKVATLTPLVVTADDLRPDPPPTPDEPGPANPRL